MKGRTQQLLEKNLDNNDNTLEKLSFDLDWYSVCNPEAPPRTKYNIQGLDAALQLSKVSVVSMQAWT